MERCAELPVNGGRLWRGTDFSWGSAHFRPSAEMASASGGVFRLRRLTRVSRLFRIAALCLVLPGALAAADADLRIAVVGADRSDPAHAALMAGVRAAAETARAEFFIETAVRDWTERAMTAEAQERVLREVIGAGCDGLVIVPRAGLRWELFADVLELAGGAVAWVGAEREGVNASFEGLARDRLRQVLDGLEDGFAVRPSPYFEADFLLRAESPEVSGRAVVGLNPAWVPALHADAVSVVVQPDVFGAGFDALRALGTALGEPRMEFLERETVPLVFTSEEADNLAALWLDWLR